MSLLSILYKEHLLFTVNFILMNTLLGIQALSNYPTLTPNDSKHGYIFNMGQNCQKFKQFVC